MSYGLGTELEEKTRSEARRAKEALSRGKHALLARWWYQRPSRQM